MKDEYDTQRMIHWAPASPLVGGCAPIARSVAFEYIDVFDSHFARDANYGGMAKTATIQAGRDPPFAIQRLRTTLIRAKNGFV